MIPKKLVPGLIRGRFPEQLMRKQMARRSDIAVGEKLAERRRRSLPFHLPPALRRIIREMLAWDPSRISA
jgi:hypothetical protein